MTLDELREYRSELVDKKTAFRKLWRASKEFKDFQKKHEGDIVDREHRRVSMVIVNREYMARNK